MPVVGPEERVAMASIRMVSRSAAGAFGPSSTTAMWNAFIASAPLVSSAVLKICYDLSPYAMFRNVKPLEEVLSAEGAPAGQPEPLLEATE